MRRVSRIFPAVPTIEGAGVHLRRAFGYPEVPLFDPFLLLDDFRSADPAEYERGFPWHPHRGIETITYMLEGSVEHGDSLGNRGSIGAGDVQWMTAGGGIIHQEMPKGDARGRMGGFQLWANLPAAHKMMAPRYREVSARDIPEVALGGGAAAKVICGALGGVVGPVRDILTDPRYLDVTVPPGATITLPVDPAHNVFAYTASGGARFDKPVAPRCAVLFGPGGENDDIEVTAGTEPARFLLVSGQPLGEPVAWRGPIVMNTRDQLQQAFADYQNGAFIRGVTD